MMGASLTLGESARRFVRYAWIEARLFEVVGRWAGDTDDRAARPVFAANAAHHAWRSGRWRERAPVGRGLPAEWSTSDIDTADLAALVDGLAALGPDETVERVRAEYLVVLPYLETTYREHLGRLVPISDGPTMRVIRQVIADVVDDLAAGKHLLVRVGGGAIQPIRTRIDYENSEDPVSPTERQQA
jgi:hypothetical protein